MQRITEHFAQMLALREENKQGHMTRFPFHIYSEIVALLICIICWRSLKASYLRWFLTFLAFIVVVEISGWYLPVYLKRDAGWVFNISVPIEYLFFSLIFYHSYCKRINQRFVAVFGVLLITYVLYFSLFKNIRIFNSYYLLIGSFSMIIMSIVYFFEQYSKEDTGNIWQEPLFWITSGVLLFNIGEFSYDLVSTFIVKNLFDPVNVLFRKVNNKLVILLYILISVGFIVCRKRSKQLRTTSLFM